jgi:hypothetical protein
MLDLIRQAMAANQAEAATYSQGVRIWMGIMSAAFLSSVIFAPWKAGARWIFAATLVNVLGLILIKAFFPELSRMMIGTSVHLVFWTPFLWMIWRPDAATHRIADFQGRFGTVYRFWLIAASAIMAISLVLDAITAIGWIL